MARLVPCPACKRHVFPTETTCPHCGKSAAPGVTLAALAVTAGLALAACDPAPVAAVYGPPPNNPNDRATMTNEPATAATDVPTTPVPVYGPAPVRPEDRAPQPQPTATATATATSAATAAPTTTAKAPAPPQTAPAAVYGPAPRKIDDRKPRPDL